MIKQTCGDERIALVRVLFDVGYLGQSRRSRGNWRPKRSMSRDMLKRNKSLLKIINDQKSWSKKEVKQIREFNGILTAKALYQASADYSDHLS